MGRSFRILKFLYYYYLNNIDYELVTICTVEYMPVIKYLFSYYLNKIIHVFVIICTLEHVPSYDVLYA